MREIEFRGKPIDNDNGLWVYGSLYYDRNCFGNITDSWIYEFDIDHGRTFAHRVMSETVGQYTGLKDKTGEKIYEGDIVRYNIGFGYTTSIGCVEFLNGWFMTYKEGGNEILQYTKEYAEIIGNIYDNPELLEVKR